MASSSGSGKRKIHKWTKEELTTVLNYLIETVQKGYEIEKPTAISYYQKLIEKTDLGSSIRAKPLHDKMNKIRGSFKLAWAWENQTGQGVKEKDGLATFRAVLLRKCPYYDECKIIWGQKANIVIPYATASDGDQQEVVDENVDNENNENDWNAEHPTDSDHNRDRSPSPVSIPDTHEVSSVGSQDSPTPFGDNRPTTSRSRYMQSAVSAGSRLNSVCKSKGTTTASSVFQEYALSKREESLEKLEVQKQQIRLDELKIKTKFSFKQDQFDHKKIIEMEKIGAEKEMLKMKLDSEAHLASLRIRELELQLQLVRESKN